MFPSLLTAICFAGAAVSARQSASLIGSLWANLLRLLFALCILGVIALLSWRGMPLPIVCKFLFAGGIGFGLGGICMMQTLQRIGSPRSLLYVESGTAVLAGLLSWLVLHDALTGSQIVACTIILAGILLAGSAWGVAPERQEPTPPAAWMLAAAAALCQALSLVISRDAFLTAAAQSVHVATFNAAFVRLAGGGIVAVLLLPLTRWTGRAGIPGSVNGLRLIRAGRPVGEQPLVWALLNSLAGPVLGVSCWLWAVSILNPGIVQSIAATAPLISVPVSRRLEWNRLGNRFFTGAAVAIMGIALLALW